MKHSTKHALGEWLVILAFVAAVLLVCELCVTACCGQVPEDHVDILHTGQPLPQIRAGNLLLVTPLYVCSLNPETKLADWVQYKITPALMETGNRLDRNWRTLHPDAALENADYDGSIYDRGHLVPLASVAASPHASTVNYLEVVAPQTPNLNRGPWLKLEEHVRALAAEHGEVLVTVGTLYEHAQPPLPSADEPHRVPSHFWLRIAAGNGSAALVECYVLPQQVVRDDLPQQFLLDEQALRGRVKVLR